MRFKLGRRPGDFGKFNPRNERHGQEKVPAADLVIRFRGGKRELDMLIPLQDKRKISEVFYDEHKHLQVPFLNPLKINRTPENVTAKIWDQATNQKKPLEFEGCKVKFSSITMHDKYNFEGELTLQMHDDPEEHSARLRMLSDNTREFELESLQEEIFDEDADEDDEKKESRQQSLIGNDDDAGSGDDDDSDDDDDEDGDND